MKNFILSVTRDVIPYVKEIRPLAKSVAGCIVMQQLDFWFARYPGGFYKFLEPCNTEGYVEGDSWTEELGMSADEFRTAFDKIGKRHTSKSLFMVADDKFEGKFYCSYHDKKEGKTFYFRNHEKTDAALFELLSKPPVTVTGKSQLQKPALPISVTGKAQLCKPALPISYSTENTAETTPKTTTTDVGDVFNNDFSVERHSPEYQELAERLTRLRVLPDRVSYLIDRFPDNVRRALDWWESHPDDAAKARSLGAAVASSITDPQKFPHIYAAPQSAETPATPKAPRKTKAQVLAEQREEFAAAYESVWQSLDTPLRELLEREGKDKFEFIEIRKTNDLAMAIRQFKAGQGGGG